MNRYSSISAASERKLCPSSKEIAKAFYNKNPPKVRQWDYIANAGMDQEAELTIQKFGLKL